MCDKIISRMINQFNSLPAFWRYWVPVLIWAGLIFLASSLHQPLPSVVTKRDWDIATIHKIGHLVVYVTFGVLLFRAFLRAEQFPLWAAILLAIGFAGAYACGDEIHQYFVHGRGCAIEDVLLDSTSAITGVTVVGMVLVMKKRRMVERPQTAA